MDSQAIVNTMEVLETKPITDLVSESVIKVCYVSDKPNPNKTVINAEIGKEIAASLPGAPVVGFFDKGTGDFEQHSRRITISNGEVNIEDITKPYGFVSPMHQPWYQDFTEDGEIRTYLMCRAYLWTRQYEEAKLAFGKGQSMELDENTMSGYYEGDVFVFTSATLDKLCILGDDYPPCFSGAQIMSTYAKEYDSLADNIHEVIGKMYYVLDGQIAEKTEEPQKVTSKYALELGWNITDLIYRQLDARGMQDEYWVQGIYTEDEQEFVILQNIKDGELYKCDIVITSNETVELANEFVPVSLTFVPKENIEESIAPLNGETIDNPDDPMVSSTVNPVSEPEFTDPAPAPQTALFKKKKDDEEESKEGEGEDESTDPEEDSDTKDESGDEGGSDDSDTSDDNTDDEKKKKPKTKNSIEEEVQVPEIPAVDFAAQIKELKDSLEEAKGQIDQYKEQLEAYEAKDKEQANNEKLSLINSYAEILEEEDLAPVRESVADFTLEEIEAKLAVTYTRKVREAKNHETPTGMQVNVNSLAPESEDLPAYIRDAMEYDLNRRINL